MAQIDELIAAMKARHADALILNSDQPAQLNFGGTLAAGALVPAPLLRAMLSEIIPDARINQPYAQGEWSLAYACDSGLMDVFVERRGAQIKLIITPHNPAHNIFTPPDAPAPNFQTYQPPAASSFAPPPAPPTYNAPMVPGYSVPMMTSQNVPSVHTPPSHLAPVKPTIEKRAAIWNVVFLWLMSGWFLPFSVLPPLLLILSHGFFAISLLLAFVAAFAVLFDARVLGVRRGLVDGFGDMDAQGWFFTTLALGVLGVPLYLSARPTYKRALEKHLLKP